MAKRDIGKVIIAGLEEIKAWKEGKAKLKTFTVAMPSAADVPAIRKELGLSQGQFALFMGVRVATPRNWEQAQREPQGPVRSLLLVAAKQPQAVCAAYNHSDHMEQRRKMVRAWADYLDALAAGAKVMLIRKAVA